MLLSLKKKREIKKLELKISHLKEFQRIIIKSHKPTEPHGIYELDLIRMSMEEEIKKLKGN